MRQAHRTRRRGPMSDRMRSGMPHIVNRSQRVEMMSGDIAQSFIPAFSSLTIFKIPRVHSVAQVTGFAEAPRISIVGWGRNDPSPNLGSGFEK